MSLRSCDPAAVKLAREVREHLLARRAEPLPASLLTRLRSSSESDRLRLVSAVVVGFGEAVDELVRDGLIEPELEEHLLRVVIGCGVRELDFDVDGALQRLSRAAARRDLLRGQLPSWHVGSRRLTETAPFAVWSFPKVSVHRAAAGEPPATWAAWSHADRALEEGLGRSLDLSGYELVGEGRLVVEVDGLRLDSPQCWLHLGLATLQAVELHADGVVLHAPDRRLALAEEDGWFLAELLRLVHERGDEVALASS